MTEYRVVFRAEALRHLDELHDYIAGSGSPANAVRFVDSLVDFCAILANFPYRGTARDDIRPGLRVIGHKRRTVIAFSIFDQTVAVLGVFYGGRDYPTRFTEE